MSQIKNVGEHPPPPSSNKRSRGSLLSKEEEEGEYTAVLKGRKSLRFQQQFSNINSNNFTSINFNDPNLRLTGHVVMNNSCVPEKACPCGVANCVVFTARTDKNFGRKFYKCPQGCGFFEWCDKTAGADNLTITNQDLKLNSSLPQLPCPCGAGSCLIFTAKTGKNIGNQFYRCPAIQGGCGFFKWCNEDNFKAGLSDLQNSSKVQRNTNEESNMSSGVTSGSSCFKCGKNGHWARDCSEPSLDSPAKFGIADSHNITKVPQNASKVSINHGVIGNSSCFKCGKGGHWARDCSQASFDRPVKVCLSNSQNITKVPRNVQEASNITHSVIGSSGTCFKCGKDGHWARDCSQASVRFSENHSSGTCLKCGRPGHWGKECVSKI